MKLGEIVSFRKDLMFNGAIQIGWVEHDPELAEKAAVHYVFHGPDYHGVRDKDDEAKEHPLIDTATFTKDVLERVLKGMNDDPFLLAVAGYGTGKSHLGVTLSSLLEKPRSSTAKKIMRNLSMADPGIGKQVKDLIGSFDQPFLVVSINGMQDFDLNNEIIRQILSALHKRGLDTSILDDLRPRFKTATFFTESFYDPLVNDFKESFGTNITREKILERLYCQDEDIFRKISTLYEQKMGSPIHAVGQESLYDFLRISKENFCGPGRPFSGIVIIFDEFGRYLEFSVQKPHVAGSGALQQLFECVQANGDAVFLLCFIQYELKAYISRIAPELRDDLNRYVTRYDAVDKVRLSSNLETLIANLLEKHDTAELDRQVQAAHETPDNIHLQMLKYFPDIRNHAVWKDKASFKKIICEGCWPLHPCTTWMLCQLSSVGKSLQQRSALSLLAEIYTLLHDKKWEPGKTIAPVDLCNDALINEFIASERWGQQGAAAHAYESVIQKYQYELNADEKVILKAVLLAWKTGIKVESKQEYSAALALLGGISKGAIENAVKSLEAEFGVLEWNERINQYEIVGDALPRKAFVAWLEQKVAEIDASKKASIFSQNYVRWAEVEKEETDFGAQHQISTREWHYRILFCDVSMLKGQINYALRNWREARGVDQEKGQLVYCYVGPESSLEVIKQIAIDSIKTGFQESNLDHNLEAPVAVLFLHDEDGCLGNKAAECWILQEQLSEEDKRQFSNFINDRKSQVVDEIKNLVLDLAKKQEVVFATKKDISGSRLKLMLTNLFETVYYQVIPFPFDGFSTIKGNAATDCQLFTRELFKGTLDRETISAFNMRQKNRAFDVLDKSWGIFDDDGSIRMLPHNPKVRAITQFIEQQFQGDSEDGPSLPVNLGTIMRILNFPPYGCNIASAGMLLAAFVGRRKNQLNILRNQQAYSMESWLADALKGNFLDMSVLDTTDLVKVSTESISEWEVLLDEWDSQIRLNGKIEYQVKAEELKERIAIPQVLYYKYRHLSDQANSAKIKVRTFENALDDALGKIESGKEKDNVYSLSWGAAELINILDSLRSEEGQWEAAQIAQVENRLAPARLHIQSIFSRWLRTQSVRNIEQLDKFKSNCKRVSRNLISLGLNEENSQLESHVAEVEKNVRLITDVKNAAHDIELMVTKNKITDAVPISVLQNWLEQVKKYALLLSEARSRSDIVQNEVKDASRALVIFQKECQEQQARHHQRAQEVYAIETISSFSELANWRNEVASLINIFEGHEKDVEDLRMVQYQLDLIENHFRRLDDDGLNESDFMALFQKCLEECEQAFGDDAPPLDSEVIYGCFKENIIMKRRKLAEEWMLRVVPEQPKILGLTASAAIDLRNRLMKKPTVLSDKEMEIVNHAIAACDRRIDELEVEGLLAKFNSMSDDNKRSFIAKIISYVKGFIRGV